MVGKRRLSVSVDAELMEAAEQAVRRGEAPTLSAYVSAGLKRQLENDRRLRAMGELIADHEREHGDITEKDIEDSLRVLQSRAIHVRPARASIKVPAVRGAKASDSRRPRR